MKRPIDFRCRTPYWHAYCTLVLIACVIPCASHADEADKGWKKLKQGDYSAAINLFQKAHSNSSIPTEKRIYVGWGLGIAQYGVGDYAESVRFYEQFSDELAQYRTSTIYKTTLRKLQSEKRDIYSAITRQQASNDDKWEKGYAQSLYEYGKQLVKEQNWESAIQRLSSLESLNNHRYLDITALLDTCHYSYAAVLLKEKKFPRVLLELSNIDGRSLLYEASLNLRDSLSLDWGNRLKEQKEWKAAVVKYQMIDSDSPLHNQAQLKISDSLYKLALSSYENDAGYLALDFFQSALQIFQSAIPDSANMPSFDESAITDYIHQTKNLIQNQRLEEAIESEDYRVMEQLFSDYPQSLKVNKLKSVYFGLLIQQAHLEIKSKKWQNAKKLLLKVPTSAALYEQAIAIGNKVDEKIFSQRIKRSGVKNEVDGIRFAPGVWVAKTEFGTVKFHYKYEFRTDNTFASWTSEDPQEFGVEDFSGTWKINKKGVDGLVHDVNIHLEWSSGVENRRATFKFSHDKLEIRDEYESFLGVLNKEDH